MNLSINREYTLSWHKTQQCIHVVDGNTRFLVAALSRKRINNTYGDKYFENLEQEFLKGNISYDRKDFLLKQMRKASLDINNMIELYLDRQIPSRGDIIEISGCFDKPQDHYKTPIEPIKKKYYYA